MTAIDTDVSRLLGVVLDHLDVPKSYYEKAASRHRSLGEWLHREGSLVAAFDPDVRPQGSFRYGTVVRPLDAAAAYDLDNVCLLRSLTKARITQAELKRLYGEEVKAYARAHNMLAPPEEHNRCWRLRYADEATFHLDTLPCVPQDPAVVRRLTDAGVPPDLAGRAVAITDRKHPEYRVVSNLWTSSNPRGFARWFESRAALGRPRLLAENRLKASVEDVPPYEWKTTLQRSIQLLKRHRDVMFRDNPDLAPISMIITNLAAHAYSGQTDLASALTNILERMPDFVRPGRPRVPNPADPFEDYADKWSRDARLEANFWAWHAAAKTDVAKLPSVLRHGTLAKDIRAIFRVDMTETEVCEFEPRPSSAPAVVRAAPALVIPTAPRPWADNG